MRILSFIIQLVKEAEKDDLFAMASQLTYKLLLAFFPFLIFLMSYLAFLNLDTIYWQTILAEIIPGEAGGIITVFFDEVISTQNMGVLSISLLFSLFTASSGFAVVIRCVNQTYGYKNCRSFIKTQLISLALVVMFAFSLSAMLVLLIFNDIILDYLSNFIHYPDNFGFIFDILGIVITAGVLLLTTMLVYKLSNCKPVKMKGILPGALFCVALWIISSKAFSIYIDNFSSYYKTYGSIAGIFILMMWLNIVSTSLLLGSELNSMKSSKDSGDNIECDKAPSA
ncbi:MAG: YihY/virulence factor BrkB family protein [Clostridiales bacterium]|jgi:membrane protein|nr:YihY/virulence factor BrkB family protein [Clostridiales bacterium]